ncbi:MAG: aldehyde dehydrogenase family protein [Deltaproteobacteria bacterium]|nr:aldehyde dehydrogenase family protein [Deltaproteobacteria bacterium]
MSTPDLTPLPYLGNYVGGRFVKVSPSKADGHLLSVSPRDVTDEIWRGTFRLEAIEEAVEAGRKARQGWGELPLAGRLKILGKIKAQLRNHREELVLLLAREAGLPLWEGEAEVKRAIELFTLLEGPARQQLEQLTSLSEDLEPVPLGLVAVLPDFASPLLDLHRGVLAVLAAGNVAIVHPHALTPGLGQLYARILDEADLPRGVFALVQGDSDLRAALAGHPGLDGVRLTSSAGMARRVARLVQEQPWKTLRMRTPGKNPLLVLPGADLERAARDAALGAYLTAGQRATSTRWVVVHRKLVSKFVPALDACATRFRVGDPLDPETVVGPLASEALRRAFLRHVRLGENEGNRVVRATGIVGADPVGWYVGPAIHEVPTILEDSRYQMYPVLGPDLPIFSVRSTEEAFALVGSLDSLLCASVHTSDAKLWNAARHALSVGRLIQNGPTTARVAALPMPSGAQGRRSLLEGFFLLTEWVRPSVRIPADRQQDDTPVPPGLD